MGKKREQTKDRMIGVRLGHFGLPPHPMLEGMPQGLVVSIELDTACASLLYREGALTEKEFDALDGKKIIASMLATMVMEMRELAAEEEAS